MYIFLVTLAMVFLWPSDSMAQSWCGERSEILRRLEQKYFEVPIGIGLSNSGGAIELLTSPKGTFTIIITFTNGLSCLIAAGNDWEVLLRKDIPNGTATHHTISPSSKREGMRVGFRGYCREMQDIFRLAQLYEADPTARAAFNYFNAPGNSCWSYNTMQMGILDERVSVNYVGTYPNIAHIWKVNVGNDGYVYVIVVERPGAPPIL